MKHILCLRECHYPFKTRVLIQFLLFSCVTYNSLGQALVFKFKVLDEVSVCQIHKTELTLFNISGSNLSNLNLNLRLPDGVEYLIGSVSGASESNISKLSSPEFTIVSILRNDSITIKVQFKARCGLFNNMNILFSIIGIVKYNTGTDSMFSKTFPIETPFLSIFPSIPDTTVPIGACFERKIVITNTGLGSLNLFFFEDRHDSLQILSTSGSLLNQTENSLKLIFDATDFLKIGNHDSLFDRNESIVIIENVCQTICKQEKIHSQILAYWGCDNDTCQIKEEFIKIDFNNPKDEAILKFIPNENFPTCICSDTGATQSLVLKNEGPQTAVNIAIKLKTDIDCKQNTEFGIVNGSISATGAAQITDVQYIDPLNCSANLYSCPVVKLSELAPGQEVRIDFKYTTCLPCPPDSGGVLTWYWDYSYDSKCVTNSNNSRMNLKKDVISLCNKTLKANKHSTLC